MSTPENPHERDLRREREDKATQLAIDTALRQQMIDQRLNAHELRLNLINGSQAEMVRVQKAMQQAVDRLEGKIDTAAEVARAVAENAKEAADKGVSTRAFYLGLLGLAVSLGAILAGTGHL